MRASVVAALVALSMVTGPAAAQLQRRGGRMPQRREELEQRIRDRLSTFLQRQLGLNDEAMKRLTDVNQKYELKRRELTRRDRDARMSMREVLRDTAGPPNDERALRLLQEMSRIEHERLDLQDAEQADLAKFLTATQRAKYVAIQEQMRRRIEDMRGRPDLLDNQGMGPGPARGMTGRGRRRPPPSP